MSQDNNNTKSKNAIRSREYRIKNAEKVKLYEDRRNERRRNDPIERSKKALIDKRWSENNPERKRNNNRIWKLNNPDKCRSYGIKYRSSHERVYNENQRMLSQLRRKSVINDNRDFSIIDIRAIDNYYSRICGICGLPIEFKFEVDHIIPLSRNGTHSLDNLQLTHPICNRTKHSRLQKDMKLDIVILREMLVGTDIS